ncbi:hypothetical protein AB6A40_007808 [Gnathostoma spinigerum]|uniref:Uncharacterized protein n=1 Tax=Gnathostoma spinigerum TaxID=75299 RepID=A0ABD6ESH0_9BILA
MKWNESDPEVHGVRQPSINKTNLEEEQNCDSHEVLEKYRYSQSKKPKRVKRALTQDNVRHESGPKELQCQESLPLKSFTLFLSNAMTTELVIWAGPKDWK